MYFICTPSTYYCRTPVIFANRRYRTTMPDAPHGITHKLEFMIWVGWDEHVIQFRVAKRLIWEQVCEHASATYIRRKHRNPGLNMMKHGVTLRMIIKSLSWSQTLTESLATKFNKTNQYVASENCGLMLTLKCCRRLDHRTTDAVNSKPCGQTVGA